MRRKPAGYDSDEDDTFLDRTGAVERKRQLRQQGGQAQQKAETYQELVRRPGSGGREGFGLAPTASASQLAQYRRVCTPGVWSDAAGLCLSVGAVPAGVYLRGLV